MKVIIHAGCAKNGSTAFQTLMAKVGPGLAAHGLSYPEAPVGHRHLAERAYLDDYCWVGEIMDTARASDASCVLLSTEHFQNLLCQKAYALGLVSAFREAGAGDVRFVFSVRAPFDYFEFDLRRGREVVPDQLRTVGRRCAPPGHVLDCVAGHDPRRLCLRLCGGLR